MLETSTLIYFFMTYVSLPSDPKTGALPWISDVYSTWPFTFCIGSLHLAVYKTFASLYESGSLINLYLRSWISSPFMLLLGLPSVSYAASTTATIRSWV